eukprot:COSAG06_NODE_265_length_18834_cov_10.938991_5_plen_93_part_00
MMMVWMTSKSVSIVLSHQRLSLNRHLAAPAHSAAAAGRHHGHSAPAPLRSRLCSAFVLLLATKALALTHVRARARWRDDLCQSIASRSKSAW